MEYANIPAAPSEGLTSKRNSWSCDTLSLGSWGLSPWQLSGPGPRGAAAPLLLGAPAQSRFQATALCPAPTGVNGCAETWSWGLEVEESYCSEMKGKEDSSFSTARQATDVLPGPGEDTPPKTQHWDLSSPPQNTTLGVSLLSQQIAFRRDSKKGSSGLNSFFFGGIVFGVRKALKNT